MRSLSISFFYLAGAVLDNNWRACGFSLQQNRQRRDVHNNKPRGFELFLSHEEKNEYHDKIDAQAHQQSRMDRRSVLNLLSVLPILQTTQGQVSASETNNNVVAFVRGTVSVPEDYNAADVANSSSSSPALYVTARPDRPDNVPEAILSGTRGKAPPVLAARFENPSFPFDFELTRENMTAEGASAADGSVQQDLNNLWWENSDLVISARLDMDGVASTRSPDDLVGRGFFKANEGNTVDVKLTGRGSFGKFVTGGK